MSAAAINLLLLLPHHNFLLLQLLPFPLKPLKLPPQIAAIFYGMFGSKTAKGSLLIAVAEEIMALPRELLAVFAASRHHFHLEM